MIFNYLEKKNTGIPPCSVKVSNQIVNENTMTSIVHEQTGRNKKKHMNYRQGFGNWPASPLCQCHHDGANLEKEHSQVSSMELLMGFL